MAVAGLSTTIIAPLIFFVKPCASQLLLAFSNHCADVNTTADFPQVELLLAYFVNCGMNMILIGMILLPLLVSIFLLDSFTGLLVQFKIMCTLPATLHSIREMERNVKFYRQIQILVGRFNDCFEMCVLPLIQFCGSFLLICTLYGTIAIHDVELSILKVVIFPFLSVMITIFVGLIIITSSMVLYGSVVAIQKLKNEKYLGIPWCQKFIRSCPPVKIRTGALLAVDRDRFAIVMRFCLQRAFFLSVLSR